MFDNEVCVTYKDLCSDSVWKGDGLQRPMKIFKNRLYLTTSDFPPVQANDYTAEKLNNMAINVQSCRDRILFLDDGEQMYNDLLDEMKLLTNNNSINYNWDLSLYNNNDNRHDNIATIVTNNNNAKERNVFFIGMRENRITLKVDRLIVFKTGKY